MLTDKELAEIQARADAADAPNSGWQKHDLM